MEPTDDNGSEVHEFSASDSAGAQSVFIEGSIERVKISFGYKIGLFAVAVAMVLLPVIYLAFVALFGYAIYYHATVNRSIFSWYLPGRLAILKVLLYFAPIVIGLILLLFLIKPLFARRVDEEKSYSLEHAEAPLLFQLIGQVCRAIGAPVPSRIDLDCTINAAASFRKGLGSFFGNDVMLTLGLPLAAGLTVQQLAGLLAHEFGHFAQGAAMRLSYLIRSINLWFARVVYERDAWDVWLIETSEEADFRIGWMFYLARFGVWISRRVLWVIMMIGHAISSFMLRQMEYDADRYEVRLAGTEAFLATNRQINHLNAAATALGKAVRTMFKERKLFDNTPELIVRHAREVPADVQAQLHAFWESEKTKWHDSHPSYAKRNARAIAAAQSGCVHDGSPATTLFVNFSELSRRITLAHYRNHFGCEVPPEFLVPVQSTNAVAEHDYASDQEAVKGYFKGVATSLRPLRFPQNKGLSFRNGDALVNEVSEAKAAMERLLGPAYSAYLTFKDADVRAFLANQALALIEAGVEFEGTEFGLTDCTQEGVAGLISAAGQQREEADTLLREYDQTVLRRLIDCQQLIRMGPIAAKIGNAPALQEQSDELLWLLGQLSTFFDEALLLRLNCAKLEALLRHRETSAPLESFASVVRVIADEISRGIATIQAKTAGTRLPFPESGAFIGAFLKNKEYCADPLELILREGNSHFEKTVSIYYRALAGLVAIASEVESAIPAREGSPRMRVAASPSNAPRADSAQSHCE